MYMPYARTRSDFGAESDAPSTPPGYLVDRFGGAPIRGGEQRPTIVYPQAGDAAEGQASTIAGPRR